MVIDKYTKFVLSAIALGLFLNFASPIIIPKIAEAELRSVDLSDIESYLRSIKNSMSTSASSLKLLSTGSCANGKLC